MDCLAQSYFNWWKEVKEYAENPPPEVDKEKLMELLKTGDKEKHLEFFKIKRQQE